MKFITLHKPLEKNVYCGNTVIIPAGAKNVKIAFRQSHMTNKYTGEKMNVYIYHGKVIHA